MTYIKLIIDFLIVGSLSFGGAYSAIPLIRDIAFHYDIITDDMLLDFIAIAESTPGSVAVNIASFVGAYLKDIFGTIVATFAVIFPAFLIILLFTIYFKNIANNDKVRFALSIIRPCIIGIITSVGLFVLYSILRDSFSDIATYNSKFTTIIILFLMISIIIIIYKKITKSKLSAIKIIVIGAILGIVINYFI